MRMVANYEAVVDTAVLLYEDASIIGHRVAEVENEYGIKIDYILTGTEEGVVYPTEDYRFQPNTIVRFYGEPIKMVHFKNSLYK
jgi:hypothetical protein